MQCANDVSARLWQGEKMGGGQWCRAKSFDTFSPIGPCLVTQEVISDPQNLRIETYLNGSCVQNSNTKGGVSSELSVIINLLDMIFSVAELISQLSQGTTLPAGTIILTGTPGVCSISCSFKVTSNTSK
jgi:2-keto-4-pentenoate hydratase/2-oxohepta-3-ene-1,7-dioic acid hydratase in catechol pathway